MPAITKSSLHGTCPIKLRLGHRGPGGGGGKGGVSKVFVVSQ